VCACACVCAYLHCANITLTPYCVYAPSHTLCSFCHSRRTVRKWGALREATAALRLPAESQKAGQAAERLATWEIEQDIRQMHKHPAVSDRPIVRSCVRMVGGAVWVGVKLLLRVTHVRTSCIVLRITHAPTRRARAHTHTHTHTHTRTQQTSRGRSSRPPAKLADAAPPPLAQTTSTRKGGS
jgi:hypothetical protein